jgi:hypothetical protein
LADTPSCMVDMADMFDMGAEIEVEMGADMMIEMDAEMRVDMLAAMDKEGVEA